MWVELRGHVIGYLFVCWVEEKACPVMLHTILTSGPLNSPTQPNKNKIRIFFKCISFDLHCTYFLSSGERKKLSDDPEDNFFMYTRGRKIPPEGLPGFDFSDPESIVEFTK